MIRQSFVAAAFAGCLCAVPLQAATVVNSFAAPGTIGSWAVTADTGGGGTVSIVDVSGVAGADPTPINNSHGAAQLVTPTNSAKAEFALTTLGGFGTAADVIAGTTAFSSAYSYFRELDPANSGSPSAPSFKLTFYNPTYAASPGNDGFVTLIYEPYWNGGNSSVTTGSWDTRTISAGSGLFWGNGGFGQGNSAGGDLNSIHTLTQWLGLFNGTSGGAFGSAVLTAITLGQGTYNPGVTGYVDNVSITAGDFNGTFDFEPAAVPEPSSMVLLGLGLVGLTGRAVRRRRKGAVAQAE